MQGCFNLFINREIQKSTANILNAVAIGAEFGFLPFVSIRVIRGLSVFISVNLWLQLLRGLKSFHFEIPLRSYNFVNTH